MEKITAIQEVVNLVNDAVKEQLVHPTKFIVGEQSGVSHGISKRELFAAMAMQGFCSVPLEMVERYDLTPVNIATFSVAHADALMVELSKAKEPVNS